MQHAFRKVAARLKQAWHRVRFGVITEKVVGTAGGGVTAEVEYRGRGGQLIGYWAFGYFDPTLPYQG